MIIGKVSCRGLCGVECKDFHEGPGDSIGALCPGHNLREQCDRCRYNKMRERWQEVRVPLVRKCDYCGKNITENEAMYVHVYREQRMQKLACVKCNYKVN